MMRRVVAVLAACLIAAAFLGYPGHSRGAALATQSSVNVAVVPGFKAPGYPGYGGIGNFPATNPRLSAYHFSQLAATNLTAGSLASYDTVILYGIRWSTISASGQAALNAFATTHKVIIWDSDNTGAQNYSTFIQPFSTLASHAGGKPQNSQVTFPSKFNPPFVNFLASSDSTSPYYLDPAQLVSNASMINDMNAMNPTTANWAPLLLAHNANIPQDSWVLAWNYGVIGNHTGMTIYSGLDADAIDNSKLNPNDEITELLLQLKAPFLTAPDTSCAPTCPKPPQPTNTPPPHCKLAKPVPTRWVHGGVSISLSCTPAQGITAKVVTKTTTTSGPVLATGTEQNGLIYLRVNTRLLRTNHISRPAAVYTNADASGSIYFNLKVDNTPPRLIYLRTRSTGHGHTVTFRLSEKSKMRIVGGGSRYSDWVVVPRHKSFIATLPGSVRHARLILVDRAGNTVTRKLAW